MDWFPIIGSLIVAGLTAGTGLLIRLLVKVERIQVVVERELTVNSGKSLRDRVVRIESQLHAYLLNKDLSATLTDEEPPH